MLIFSNSEIMTMFQDFVILYCKMLKVSINYKSSLSMVFWCWLLIVGRSKIWTFAETVNFFAFLKVVCKKDLLLFQLVLFLPAIKAKGWEVYAWELAFTEWNLYCGLGAGLISLEFFFFKELVFNLISSKCIVFCFAFSILKYFFFPYSHCLFHNM